MAKKVKQQSKHKPNTNTRNQMMEKKGHLNSQDSGAPLWQVNFSWEKFLITKQVRAVYNDKEDKEDREEQKE